MRPAEDIALYRAQMAEWPGSGELREWQEFNRDWVAASDRCRRGILHVLRAAGPLPSRKLPRDCEPPWVSSGWTNDKNVTRLPFEGRAALLEMYKPASKRRWGYFALPALSGDRLVGKLDAKADRKAGVLVVNAVHQDVPFTPDMAAGIDQEIAGLAGA